MAELQLALDTCQAENTRLKQQLNCDVSKCAITVYKQCDQAESCGTKNGVSCAYLPDGLGETECATMPCPAVAGRWQLTMSQQHCSHFCSQKLASFWEFKF